MLRIPAALPQTASPQQLLVGGLQLTAAFFFFCLNIFAFKELKQRENASPSQTFSLLLVLRHAHFVET